MQNPWLDLPEKAPFVLPDDEESILSFNAQAKPVHQIRLEFLPEPYLGNPQANIILLNGNPAVDERDQDYHQDANFVKANRATLLHDSQEYPFYLLNPQFESAPGYEWWYKKLRQLLDQYGLKEIANKIFAIEYFPYHSVEFGFHNGVLASQRYSFYLLEEAMKRNALIILMRKSAEWQEMCPLLRNYHRCYELRNKRNVAITVGNVLGGGYLEILKVLKQH